MKILERTPNFCLAVYEIILGDFPFMKIASGSNFRENIFAKGVNGIQFILGWLQFVAIKILLLCIK